MSAVMVYICNILHTSASQPALSYFKEPMESVNGTSPNRLPPTE